MSSPIYLTVLARCERPHAGALAASLVSAGAGADLLAVVVDDPASVDDRRAARGAGERPPRLPRAADEHALRMLSATGRELARRLTPFVLADVLATRRGPIVLVAPSTWVAAPATELGMRPPVGGLRLVPTRRDRRPAATASPRRGHRRDCLTVSPGAEAFLAFWQSRELDGAAGVYDGEPIDEAAACFDHDVVSDPGIGVDAWNVAAGSVTGRHPHLSVDGAPLRTFHFDGFDPAHPHLATPNAPGPPPLLLSSNEPLRRLHEDYAAAVQRFGHDQRDRSYGWNRLPSGLPVDAAMRHVFLTAYRSHRLGVGPPPPDPFAADGFVPFLRYLNEPEPDANGMFSRYVWALYRTWPGLDQTFGAVLADGRRHFVHWLQHYGRADCAIPSVIDLPHPRAPRAPADGRGRGVNVAGYLHADLGLGVAARRCMEALESVAVPVAPVPYHRTRSLQHCAGADESSDAPFDVNLVCVTAEQFPSFHMDMGDDFFAGRHTIGYWFWELETFPDDQLGALALVDEVWAASGHIQRALAPLTAKPVVHMPVPLVAPRPSARSRASFGLTGDCTFLFVFDFQSVGDRKNPIGLVEAFVRAFPAAGSARLVLKTINGTLWPHELEELRCAVAGRDDVTVHDGYLSDEDLAALVAACDCYVSLHRAEGLGLTLADAMALGKPVIATAYSGNLDFMDDTNSLLVPFTYAPVPAGIAAYPEGAKWAEPDLDHAARLMREVASDPERGARLGERARADIIERWSVPAVGRRMRVRLEEVWSNGALSRTPARRRLSITAAGAAATGRRLGRRTGPSPS